MDKSVAPPEPWTLGPRPEIVSIAGVIQLATVPVLAREFGVRSDLARWMLGQLGVKTFDLDGQSWFMVFELLKALLRRCASLKDPNDPVEVQAYLEWLSKYQPAARKRAIQESIRSLKTPWKMIELRLAKIHAQKIFENLDETTRVDGYNPGQWGRPPAWWRELMGRPPSKYRRRKDANPPGWPKGRPRGKPKVPHAHGPRGRDHNPGDATIPAGGPTASTAHRDSGE